MPVSAPHSRDLRKGRYSSRGQVYLVTFCCAGRRAILREPALAAIVVEALKVADHRGDTRTFAYVVMPDHVHWVFELTGCAPLQRVVGQLKGWTALRMNRAMGGVGRLWQAGFHDHAVRRDESLETICGYVVENPVRAGLVARATDFAFSWTIAAEPGSAAVGVPAGAAAAEGAAVAEGAAAAEGAGAVGAASAATLRG